MKGKLVFSRKRKYSVWILLLITLIAIIFGIPFEILQESGMTILTISILIIIGVMMWLVFFLMYSTYLGYNFDVYEHAIEIDRGFFYRKFKDEDLLIIYDENINKILYLNKSIIIYYNELKSKNTKYVRIQGGFFNKEFSYIVKDILTERKGENHWKGPPVYNVNNTNKEDQSFATIFRVIIGILLLPLIIFIIPMNFFIALGVGFDFSFIVEISLILYFPLLFVFMLIIFPMRIIDRKSYKNHGDRISIWGGVPNIYTEYFYNEIESMKEGKILPYLHYFNIKRYKYYNNPYSTTNSRDVYFIILKDNYSMFEEGDYAIIKEKFPKVWKKCKYVTIPKEVMDQYIKQGVKIGEEK